MAASSQSGDGSSFMEETTVEIDNNNIDSDVDLEHSEDDDFYRDIFDSEDSEEEDFYGYVSDGWTVHVSESSESPSTASCTSASEDEQQIDFESAIPIPPLPTPSRTFSPPPKKKKTKKKDKQKKKKFTLPTNFSMNVWVDGSQVIPPLPDFEEHVGFKVDIDDDANELYFLQLFLPDELFENITEQTNLYAEQFFQKNTDDLKSTSRLLRFENGTTVDRMKRFIAITFLMGIIHKDNAKQYWSTDELISTPFFRTLMSRNEYATT